MPVTAQELEGMLKQSELRFEQKGLGTFVLAFKTRNFKDTQGRDALLVAIQLDEDGGYIKFFAPLAFTIQGPHADAFLKACMQIQWMTRLIQFEFDANDGEVRPMVEFPIEDGKITLRQFQRCLYGLTSLVDDAYPTLKRALDTGVVSFEDTPGGSKEDPLQALRQLIEKLRSSKDPADQARLKALEDLLKSMGGGSEPPTTV